MWHPAMPEAYQNQILTADCRAFAAQIPDESCDLIFTDPVYERIEDYAWLAETAQRILKPNSACLVWYDHPRFDAAYRVMVPPLTYVWQMYWQRYGAPTAGRAGITVITPCLWLEKGRSRTYRKIGDAYGAGFGGDRLFEHKWSKPYGLVRKWVDAFTKPGMVVADFFCGSGVVPGACTELGRNYLACEIDPHTASKARQAVSRIQVPHPDLVGQEGWDMGAQKKKRKGSRT